MEQFNLDTWLKDKSRKICTRDGRPVRIVCWDSPNKAFPIVGFINNNSTVFVWDNYGYSKSGNVESKNDLFFEDEEENLSEDERIRKEIYRYFRDLQLSSDREFSPSTSIDEILAWLEKQSEQELDIRYSILDKLIEADDIYQMSVNDAMICEARNKAISALSKLEIYKSLGFEKNVEQKPVEWNEEDTANLNRIALILLDASEVKEWWKEYRLIEKDEMEKLTSWLKSIKPQNHWKPSKEQMETLKFAANDYCMGETKKNLESLYNDLKKL